MAIDDLVEAIAKIHRNIEQHGESLASNKIRTRQVLIDPLLMALGWDVTDPSLVTLEYETGRGSADYALISGSEPVVLIEAERLGNQLTAIEAMSILHYSKSQGIRYLVVTDGDRWKMYEVSFDSTLDDKLRTELRIVEKSAYENALHALCLWRHNVSSEAGLVQVVKPFFDSLSTSEAEGDDGRSDESVSSLSDDESSSLGVSSYETTVTEDFPRHDQHASGRLQTDNRQNIISYSWYALNDVSFDPTGLKPYSVKIGESESQVSQWADIVQAVVEWMFEDGILTWRHCPLSRTPYGATYLVNDTPTHANGNRFRSMRRLRNGMWLDTAASAKQNIGSMIYLLESFGADPGVVRLKVLDSARRRRRRRSSVERTIGTPTRNVDEFPLAPDQST